VISVDESKPSRDVATNQNIKFGELDFSLAGNPAEVVANPLPVAAWKGDDPFQVVEFVGCVAVDKTPTASRRGGPNNVVRAAGMSVNNGGADAYRCCPRMAPARLGSKRNLMTAVASKRTSAERRPGSSSK
jgi:hypothetical protein